MPPNDHDAVMPYIAEHRRLTGAFQVSGVDQDFFDQTVYWTVALRPYAGVTHGRSTLTCPLAPLSLSLIVSDEDNAPINMPPGAVRPSMYTYSTALFTGPALWREHEPVVGPSQLGPVRAALIRHPSQKTMFFERFGAHLARRPPKSAVDAHAVPVTIALADGSAMVVAPDGLPPPIANPFYPGGPGAPLLHTRDGALGRDF